MVIPRPAAVVVSGAVLAGLLLSGAGAEPRSAVPTGLSRAVAREASDTRAVARSSRGMARVAAARVDAAGADAAGADAAGADVAGVGTATTTRRIVVVLDPGHNGGNARHRKAISRLVPAGGFLKPCNTTGTATASGYSEHAFTWDVAKRTARILRRHGITVVFTRRSDKGVGPCVNKRAAVGNRAHAALVVAIHADGASSSVRGYHVIEPALSPDHRNRRILKRSAFAARDLLRAFGRATKEPRAKYPGALVKPGLTRRNDLAGLNLSRVPAVFIECANMRNRKDSARLRSGAWRQRAARGIASGILAYVR